MVGTDPERPPTVSRGEPDVVLGNEYDAVVADVGVAQIGVTGHSVRPYPGSPVARSGLRSRLRHETRARRHGSTAGPRDGGRSRPSTTAPADRALCPPT